MCYEPEQSNLNSSIMRRIAWAKNQTMTEIFQTVIEEYAKSMDPELVCESCRDRDKCDHCPFNKECS